MLNELMIVAKTNALLNQVTFSNISYTLMRQILIVSELALPHYIRRGAEHHMPLQVLTRTASAKTDCLVFPLFNLYSRYKKICGHKERSTNNFARYTLWNCFRSLMLHSDEGQKNSYIGQVIKNRHKIEYH